MIPGNDTIAALKPRTPCHPIDDSRNDQLTNDCVAHFKVGFINGSGLSLTRADHCGAHPVATGTDTAVALYLGLCSVFICLILQGTFCRTSHSHESIQTNMFGLPKHR